VTDPVSFRHRRAVLCPSCASVRGITSVATFERYTVSYNYIRGCVNTGMDGRLNGDPDHGHRGDPATKPQRVLGDPNAYQAVRFTFWRREDRRSGWLDSTALGLLWEAQSRLSQIAWTQGDSIQRVLDSIEEIRRTGGGQIDLAAASFDSRDLDPDELEPGVITSQYANYSRGPSPAGVDEQVPTPDPWRRLRLREPTLAELAAEMQIVRLIRWYTPRPVLCQTCVATGRVRDGRRCYICHGAGNTGRDLHLGKLKRPVVRAWIALLPEASNRQIGRIVGVGHELVQKCRERRIVHPVKQAANPDGKGVSGPDFGRIDFIMKVSRIRRLRRATGSVVVIKSGDGDSKIETQRERYRDALARHGFAITGQGPEPVLPIHPSTPLAVIRLPARFKESRLEGRSAA
jgi:hypothetical protein